MDLDEEMVKWSQQVEYDAIAPQMIQEEYNFVEIQQIPKRIDAVSITRAVRNPSSSLSFSLYRDVK